MLGRSWSVSCGLHRERWCSDSATYDQSIWCHGCSVCYVKHLSYSVSANASSQRPVFINTRFTCLSVRHKECSCCKKMPGILKMENSLDFSIFCLQPKSNSSVLLWAPCLADMKALACSLPPRHVMWDWGWQEFMAKVTAAMFFQTLAVVFFPHECSSAC